jgi:hypothetical protein
MKQISEDIKDKMKLPYIFDGDDVISDATGLPMIYCAGITPDWLSPLIVEALNAYCAPPSAALIEQAVAYANSLPFETDAKAWDTAYKTFLAGAQSKGDIWIRVEDIKPDEGQNVMIYSPLFKTAQPATYKDGKFERFDNNTTGDRTFLYHYVKVVKWQPFPSLPAK